MAIDKRPVDVYSSRSGLTVTPNDTTDLPKPTRRILAGSDGTVDVILQDDEDTNILSLPVKIGIEIHVRARRIMTTSSASPIIALF